MGGSASSVSMRSKQGRSKRGVGLVQHVADVIVRRNFADPEQGLAVGAAMAFLQRALKGEKRRALHEKHRESRKAEIGDLDIAATPLSRVAEKSRKRPSSRTEGRAKAASQP